MEQASLLPSYDKADARGRITSIAASLPSHSSTFYFTGSNPLENNQLHIDAMWASLQTGVPTLNGYSGNTPNGWDLQQDVIQSKEQEQKLRTGLVAWTNKYGMEMSKIAWLRQDNAGVEPFARVEQLAHTEHPPKLFRPDEVTQSTSPAGD